MTVNFEDSVTYRANWIERLEILANVILSEKETRIQLNLPMLILPLSDAGPSGANVLT